LKHLLSLAVVVACLCALLGWCALLSAGGIALAGALPMPNGLRGVALAVGSLGGLALALWSVGKTFRRG
jgi:hypothetical protein